MKLYAVVINGSIVNIAYFDKPQSLPWVDASTLPDIELLVFYQNNIGQKLDLACQNYIYAGFSSSALGEVYTYPSDEINQRNIVIAGAAATLGGSGWSRLFWCADAQGIWEMRAHNATQMQQINYDFDAFLAAAQYKLVNLKNQLASATTSAQAVAVVWT